MKKLLLICLVGLLCLPTSTLLAQVADSPGADFLHRLRPIVSFGLGDTHRGGETRSDTLPKKSGLVDYSAQGQEGEGSSASEEEALIYGELINPDSLGPIGLRFTQYFINSRIGYDIQESVVIPEQGALFDGVLDPRVEKFNHRLPLHEVGYVTVSVGDKVILEDFMIGAGDSVMIGFDFQLMRVVFGGPDRDWFEAQYSIRRDRDHDLFDNPRVMMNNDPEELLGRLDYRKQWKENERLFSPKLLLLKNGESAVDTLVSKLMIRDYHKIPGWGSLLSFKDKISEERYELLKVEVVGDYYGKLLSLLRNYQYHLSIDKKDYSSAGYVKDLLPGILVKLELDIGNLKESTVSAGYHLLLSEWYATEALLTERSFQEVVYDRARGELRDKLLMADLAGKTGRGSVSRRKLAETSELITSPVWKKEAESLKTRFSLGKELLPATITGLEGDSLSWSAFQGKPVLLYFYFSTCTHSANFFKNYLWPVYQELKEVIPYQLIAVSVDNDPALWKSSISEYSNQALMNFNMPADVWAEWLDYYLVKGYPRTMLLDSHGKLISLRVKGDTYEEYRSNLIKLLEMDGDQVAGREDAAPNSTQLN